MIESWSEVQLRDFIPSSRLTVKDDIASHATATLEGERWETFRRIFAHRVANMCLCFRSIPPLRGYVTVSEESWG